MVEPPRGEPALVETDLDSLDSEAAAVSVAPSTVADAIDAAIDAELSLAEAADLEEQERALENATGDGDGGAGHGGGGGGGDGDGDGDDRSVDDYSVISSLSAGTARPDPRWADPRGGGLAIPIEEDDEDVLHWLWDYDEYWPAVGHAVDVEFRCGVVVGCM